MKPFRLDVVKTRARLADVVKDITFIKNSCKPVREGRTELEFIRNGHKRKRVAFSRVEPGRSLDSIDGLRLYHLKNEATILCSALAIANGNWHRSPLALHPDGLLQIAGALAHYRDPLYKGPPQVVRAEAETAENDEYGSETNPVYAVEGS